MLADPSQGLGGQDGWGVIPVRALLPVEAMKDGRGSRPGEAAGAAAGDVDMLGGI